MNEKYNTSSFHYSFCFITIFFTILIAIFIVIESSILNTNHIAIAQQQPEQQQVNTAESNNQTLSLTKQQTSPFIEDGSFDIDNVTFSHHMASVNGIQMHYVIGGKGDPIVLLHGWPQTWYAWRHIMPDLAKNYTVIVPDLRGLGDSSKPFTGYDGKTTAEDIYQLVSQLGFKQIFLIGHDIGAQTAYSYAAIHPKNVSKLVVMELTFPGYMPPPSLGSTGLWWISFHQTPDIPEILVQGKEWEYLTWFYRGLAYNPSAITQADIDEFVSHYSAPGGMRAGFEYYKAFPQNAKDNIELAATVKLTIPVLVLSGDIYPVLGGDIHGSMTLNSIQSLALAANVQGVIVPYSGHWIPEERPDFLLDQLSKFFGNSNNDSK
jgi:pimeloyl-ACP methyl ester carboxylesterase